MFHYAFSAVAAAAITFGAVSALNAETPTKVSVNDKGEYCLTTPAVTGSRIDSQECHSSAVWAKKGVTFSRAPKQVASR
jgi:hypothetical protein